jgi:hypothetical protein
LGPYIHLSQLSSADALKPIHFLANSVIGQSFYIQAPTDITYTKLTAAYNITASTYANPYTDPRYTESTDSACWAAFRANNYVLPNFSGGLANAYHANSLGNTTTFGSVDVQYDSNCTQYMNNANFTTAISEANLTLPSYSNTYGSYSIGDCYLGRDVVCVLGGGNFPYCSTSSNTWLTLDFFKQQNRSNAAW